MTELSAKAKKLLERFRDVDDPTPGERSRGDAAVRRMLEAQGMRDLPPLAPPELARGPLAARSGAAIKSSWLVGAAFIATMGMFGLWRSWDTLPLPKAQSHEPAAALTTSTAPQPEAAMPTSASDPVSAPPARPVHDSENAPPPSAGPQRKHDKPARDSLAQELRFLSSVDAEIRAGAYERALRRLQQHKGPSALQEERAAMRVLALCGRDADGHANSEREQFLKASPSSVLAARVRAACAGAASP